MGNSESKPPGAVIAIEIGHVNSGFAYSLENNNDHIYTANFGCVLPMDRVPTILLLSEDEKFDSFGIAARDKYLSLSLQEEHTNYRYFNNFEVVHDGHSTGYILKDNRGNPTKAERIYAIIIEYLYNLGIANIPNNSAEAKNVRVVLTIPDSNGDYMWDIIHAAARSVGIKEENICIVFNGDAAALYCSKQNLFVDTHLATSKIKTKYIMMDLGGRKTAILTKPFDGNKRKEFQDSVIVPCGGESVTEFFLNELGSTKDEKEWANFQQNCIYDFECIKLNFEKFKHKFNGTDKFILELPVSFCKLSENSGGELSIVREEFINATDNKIVITKEAMQKLFDPSIEQIVNELKNVQMDIGLGEEEVAILLAGGFSESPYVRKIISREMNPSKVLLVPNPSLDVLKGAVMTGYTKFRRAKYSYGILSRLPRNSYKFDKLIEKRELLDNGKVYLRTLTFNAHLSNTSLAVSLWKTKKTAPESAFSDITDYAAVGRVKIQPPDFGWQKTDSICELRVIVKENELHLVLTEEESKCKGSINVPFEIL